MELSLRPCSPLTDRTLSHSLLRSSRRGTVQHAWPFHSAAQSGKLWKHESVPIRCFSVVGDPEQDAERLQWSFVPPCRYGWNCWRPGCVFAHDQARERLEHVRDLAEFWTEAARPLGIAKHRTTTESEIAVPPGVAGSFGPGERDTTNAAATAVAKPAGEGRPLGRVPRRNLNSQRVPVVLNLLGPEQMA